MEFDDLVKSRVSEHAFLPGNTISDKEYYTILESVVTTPSGYNAQPWHFLLLRDSERLKEVQALCYNQEHVTRAGNLVVVLGNVNFGKHEQERICKEWAEYRDFDVKKVEALKSSLLKEREGWKKREMMIRNVSLACMTFLFAAENKGWATCPMMGFRQLDLRRYLELPEDQIPVLLIALGKRDEGKSLGNMPRKTPEEISSFEYFEKE